MDIISILQKKIKDKIDNLKIMLPIVLTLWRNSNMLEGKSNP
ncbi:MAG: hypothetical protein CM15mV124_210 [uncultured marine virus]|nr:MAG: hypothetical protein CM15mV124_210 [uncultured marine virus]